MSDCSEPLDGTLTQQRWRFHGVITFWISFLEHQMGSSGAQHKHHDRTVNKNHSLLWISTHFVRNFTLIQSYLWFLTYFLKISTFFKHSTFLQGRYDAKSPALLLNHESCPDFCCSQTQSHTHTHTTFALLVLRTRRINLLGSCLESVQVLSDSSFSLLSAFSVTLMSLEISVQ